jgi:hypothetical protein
LEGLFLKKPSAWTGKIEALHNKKRRIDVKSILKVFKVRTQFLASDF